MNIGIDVSLLKIKLAGMGIYVKEMVEYFSLLDRENHFYLFTNAELVCELKLPDNFIVIKSEVKPHIVWLRYKLPYLLKQYKIDIFWQPDHILPPKIRGVEYYVTVHDLSAYKFHNVAMKRVEIVFKLFLKRTCRDATKIIAISNYTRKDIVETLGVDEEKIEVIYNGDSPYARESNISARERRECLQKYDICCPYWLFVGTINPRKNVLTIIKAFNEFREKYAQNSKLVIVGQYGWNSQDVLEEIKKSNFSEDIVVTGFVSEREKEILYRNAACFLFPSVLEGFGFPVLEALSVGTPIVLSSVSSLPEVGGSAAFYLQDLYDYKEMADIVNHIYTMDQEERGRVRELGYEQVKLFNRRDCATEILRLLTGRKE